MKTGKNSKLYNECWKILKEIAKIKAGHKCELTKTPDDVGLVMNIHHFVGKATNALCFDSRGILYITQQRHIMGCHNKNQSVSMEYNLRCLEILKAREGENIIDILQMQKNNRGADLRTIKMQLEQELKNLKNKS
jgi:hypothetical protein